MSYGRSVSAQAVARILYVATGTVVFIGLARLLGPEGLGRYAFIVNLFNIAVSAADLGTTGILSRDLVASGSAQRQFVGNFIMFRLGLGCTIGVVSALLAVAVAPTEVLPPLLVCSLLLPLNAARFFDPVVQYLGRPWISAWLALTYVLALPLSTALALVVSNDPPYWAVIAYAAAGAAYAGGGLVVVLRLGNPDFGAVTISAIWQVAKSAAPLGVAGLLGIVTLRLDLVLLGVLGTSDMVGEYNAAFRFFDLGVAVIVTLLTPLVSIFAHFAVYDRHRLVEALRAAMRAMATGGLLAALLTPSLSRSVIMLLYGADYLAAAPVLDILVWKLLTGAINLLLVSMLMTVGSIRFVWISALCCLVFNIVLNLVLIPRFGILGAAVAALLTDVPQTVITLIAFRKALPGELDAAWWGRIALAVCVGAVVLQLCPGPPAVRASGVATAFLGTLWLMGALPRNPLSTLQIR